MPRPLPVSACYAYTPNDFDPGYKYSLLSKSISNCPRFPHLHDPCGGYEPGKEFKVHDNSCVRLAFRGLEVKRDCSFKLMFGWGTTESFNRAFRLLDGKLLEYLQACQQTGEVFIEFEDKYLYDVYTDIPYINPLTGGRYVLQGVLLECVNAQLEWNHKVAVIEAQGHYTCLEHQPLYREVDLVRECLNS